MMYGRFNFVKYMHFRKQNLRKRVVSRRSKGREGKVAERTEDAMQWLMSLVIKEAEEEAEAEAGDVAQ